MKKILSKIIVLIICFTFMNSFCQKKDEQKCELMIVSENIVFEIDNNDAEDLYKKQLAAYHNDNNEFDFIFYHAVSGEKDKTLRRIYKTDNQWFYTELINGNLSSQKELSIDETQLKTLLVHFKTKGILQNCGLCLHCPTYVSLIKYGNQFFSYNYSQNISHLSESELKLIAPYKTILDFFRKYNIELTR
ncbi:hypothetical protein [Chryseobacterium sp. JUb7]|uniref:hypothetical protein n=1 Tax=Chryseobacterium sp. JUb7 TaxID=2940599 RepID=UPI002169AAB0|nr:hypothetical protein [Chryseobacterium sp. JUb7]MCS3529608.1 hypothetical protein [Chryseobacterium sp. JUb7]